MSPSLSPQLSVLHRLCWTALMAALIATGAFLHLQIGPVPISFQDMFVALAGLVLGPRHGCYAVALYILAGCAGLPVFAGGRAGLGHVVGPTGGFLLSFFPLAFCAGFGGRAAAKLARARGGAPGPAALGRALAWLFLGYVFVFTLGPGWLAFTMHLSPSQALALGVLPLLPLTPLKMAACLALWRALHRRGLLPQ